ncbi:hypothetical protein CCMA1212_007099 [Trichoderma ghanense]|uniref:Uncharacterized protein n=1 Tax=Trichoderma ghanense TaxID=65468 RepID=A0ABY2GXE7_9HYPO
MPGYGYGSRRAESDEEDAWEYKKPNKEKNAQFIAGSIPRPIRKIRRKKNQDGDPTTVASSTKEEQHADTTASEEAAALTRAYEEQQARGEAAAYENPPIEDEESDRASSREEEQSPTVEHFEATLDHVPAMAPGPSLNDELGSDYDGYSDNGEIVEASSDEDDLDVDPVGASPPPPSNATSDGSSDAGNDLVESTSTESARSLEADALEMRRECDGLKKELDSRDKQIVALMEELKSHDERSTALEADLVSRDERIAALTKDLESHDEKLATLEKELETREEQLTTLTNDLESRRDQRVAALEKERESHAEETDAIKKNLASRNEEIAALRKQSEARNSEIAALEKELGSRNKELESRAGRLGAMEREGESHKEELESRAERIAAMKKELQSRNEKFAVLEKDWTLRGERISELEAQNSQLTNETTKTVSTCDSATNTEASPGDAVLQRNSPGVDENRQRTVTAKLEQLSSPASPFAMKTAEVVRFVQLCSAMLKTFYLACISLAGTASIRARSFISSVGRSESFQKAVDAAQQSVRASAIYLATPFWIILSFAMFMSIWRERSYWVQANAVTRKHLLKHATGVSEVADWEVFFAIGSAAMS